MISREDAIDLLRHINAAGVGAQLTVDYAPRGLAASASEEICTLEIPVDGLDGGRLGNVMELIDRHDFDCEMVAGRLRVLQRPAD